MLLRIKYLVISIAVCLLYVSSRMICKATRLKLSNRLGTVRQMEDVNRHVHRLIAAAVQNAASSGRELAKLRGVAFFDGTKDSFIESLEPFAAVESGIRLVPNLAERYGIDQSRRLTLQLVYQYFARAGSISINTAVVDALWADFLAELESLVWLTRCVTNLRHFQCANFHVDLGDGVSIRGRDPEVLAALGFDDAIQERLLSDWHGFGASSFVLVAESASPKRPENFIGSDDGNVWMRCARAVGAMRLIASGDVGNSAVFFQRVARFNVGIGGIHSSGSTVDTLGSPFVWNPQLSVAYNEVYEGLARLERGGYGKAPGNLDLALRAFMSTYDRFPTAMDTKLVDAITALEAVLGTDSEIAFKLSFRVASLLADTDEQRSILLKTIKGYYDTRSRIVHGGRPSNKHSTFLSSVDELRNTVRRLLRCFVLFAADDSRKVDKQFFAQNLDAALVNAGERDKLRMLLRLTEVA
jgi:Apea-like HEPN